MRIITLNVNGIRSAAKKGFFHWMAQQAPDIVCLQETKAQAHQLCDSLYWPTGYQCYYTDAIKKGYSGVALYSRHQPDNVIHHLGWEDMDNEGRYVEARFGHVSVVSIYFPSGSSSPDRQRVKFTFLERFLPYLRECAYSGRDYIFCGDWNIAHKPIDLKNWRANQKYSGFLPEERAWLDTVIEQDGWIDTFRSLHPDSIEYTWWSYRGRAWANNVGWRIDYQIITPRLLGTLCTASVYTEKRFSDHAPLTVDYSLVL